MKAKCNKSAPGPVSFWMGRFGAESTTIFSSVKGKWHLWHAARRGLIPGTMRGEIFPSKRTNKHFRRFRFGQKFVDFHRMRWRRQTSLSGWQNSKNKTLKISLLNDVLSKNTNGSLCPTVRRNGIRSGPFAGLDIWMEQAFLMIPMNDSWPLDERPDTRSAVGIAELLIFCNLILITNTHIHTQTHTLICIYSLFKMNEKKIK